MKIRIFILLFASLSCVVSVLAQNKIMLLHQGDNLDGKVKFEEDHFDMGYSSDFTYNIGPVPVAVTRAFPEGVDLMAAAQSSVNKFQSMHLYNGRVDFDRDLLDVQRSWYHLTEFDDAPWWYQQRKDSVGYKVVRKAVCSNKMLQEVLYNWLFPAYRDAFSVMSVPEQRDYLKMLNDAVAFADTFNLDHQNAMVARDDDYANNVGGLNAFVYRRVSKKELTREECISWLTRIINDLTPAMRKNPTAADTLVLLRQIYPDYYAAVRYTDADEYGALYSIVRKQNEQYSILPIPLFGTAQMDEPQGNFIVAHTTINDVYGRGIFYCDSSGWTYSSTQYSGDTKEYTFLGTGKNARVALIYSYDWEYINDTNASEQMAIAAIVDLDSGTVIIDSVGIPEVRYYTDYDYAYDDSVSTSQFPVLKNEHIIFKSYKTKLYGVMNNLGDILLQPNYKSIAFTEDPDVVKVNGKKKVSVYGGGKPLKK